MFFNPPRRLGAVLYVGLFLVSGLAAYGLAVMAAGGACAAEIAGPAGGAAVPVPDIVRDLIGALRPAAELAAQHLFELLLAALVALIYRYTGIQLRTERRDLLHSAVHTGIGQGLARVGNPHGALSPIDAEEVIEAAVAWARGSGAGDTVKRMGLGYGELRGLALSKLADLGHEIVDKDDEDDESPEGDVAGAPGA